MGARKADNSPVAFENEEISVWDTQYAPPSKAFTVFREAVCKGFMPWTPEYKSDRKFQGRIEALAIGQGSIGRFRMSPLVAIRSKQDIANSAHDCFYGHFVVSGGLKVEQGGRTNYLKIGDLVVHDGSTPTTLTSSDRAPYEVFTLLIPKDSFSTVGNAEDRFRNAVVTREQMIAPLSSCLRVLAENMLASSANELGALFDACVTLLPVAAYSFEDNQRIVAAGARTNYLLSEILDFVNHNISNIDLSPQHAADHMGISVRYVHKLFLASGMAFSSYVLARRLDHVRRDLLSLASPQPIFLIALRWGFRDLSTFSKAFKRKFGCSPSCFKMAIATQRLPKAPP